MNKKQRYQGFRKFSIKAWHRSFADIHYTIGRNQWLFLSYLFRSTPGKTFCFHFSDFIDDQSEYGK